MGKLGSTVQYINSWEKCNLSVYGTRNYGFGCIDWNWHKPCLHRRYVRFKTRSELIKHLQDHNRKGHKVPESVFRWLEDELYFNGEYFGNPPEWR